MRQTTLLVIAMLLISHLSFGQTLDDLLKIATDPNASSKDLEDALQNTADATNKANGTNGFEKVTDQGISHDLHKQYIGKIAVSNQEIGKKTTSSSNFKTSLSSLSGGIYGQVYLEKSLRNYRADLGASNYGRGYTVEYYADGKLISTSGGAKFGTEEDEQWTTWQIIPAPSSSDTYMCEDAHAFAEGLKKVSAGKHKMKMVLNMHYGDPRDINTTLKKELASAEFDLTFTDSEKKTFVNKHEYKYAEPSSNTSTMKGRVYIEIENQSGATISYSIMGDGMSESGSVYNGQKGYVRNAPIGYWLKVNGKDFWQVPTAGGKVIVK